MRRTFAKLRTAIATLLIAVLMVLPVADAFACSLEQFDVHAAVVLDGHPSSSHDDAGKGDGSADAHGVCAHGHCHHTTANVAANRGLSCTLAHVVQAVPQFVPPALGVYELPLRPPRG